MTDTCRLYTYTYIEFCVQKEGGVRIVLVGNICIEGGVSIVFLAIFA